MSNFDLSSMFRQFFGHHETANHNRRRRCRQKVESLETRTMLAAHFGNQILYDGEPGSVPSLGVNCMEYMQDAAGEGIGGGHALQTQFTGFHTPTYTLYCGGEDRRDFTAYDAIEFQFRSPSADPGDPQFWLSTFDRQSNVVRILDYIDSGVIDNTWRSVRIPLSDLEHPNWDLGNVERLFWDKQPTSREYFIDDIVLLDQTAPQAESIELQSEDVLKITLNDRYDPATVRDLSNYRLVSPTDPNYATPVNAADTGINIRFQYMTDSLAPVTQFDVMVRFDDPLVNGHDYTLSVQGIADHAGNTMDAATADFTFDDTSLHNPAALHVNQVGYLPDRAKIGYVGGYTGDLGGRIWAVGEDGSGSGVIYSRDDHTPWQTHAVPTTSPIRAIAAMREDDAWAVGDSGTILHWDGTSWQTTTSPTTADLLGIAFGTTGLGWIVGAGGVALRYDGSGQWSEVATGVATNLRDVWLRTREEFAPATDLDQAWAVGDGGTILKWNGSMWQPQTSPTTEDLYSIDGHNFESLYAVGTNGTVVRTLFGSWRDDLQKPTTTETLRTVVADTNTQAWVAGDGGTLWYTFGRGNPLTELDSGTTQDLQSIIRRDARQFYSAGTAGTLVSDDGLGAGLDTDPWQQGTLGDASTVFHGMFSLPYGVLRIGQPAPDVTIRDALTDQAVLTVPLELRAANDYFSGEDVYTFDFSTLTAPGVYEAYVPGIGVSDAFTIADDVYAATAITAGRGFLYQRASIALEEPFADPRFARPINHWFDNGPNSTVIDGWYHPSLVNSPLYNGEPVFQGDPEAPAPNPADEAGSPIDISQGWFDAGDYGKYIGPAVDALWHLFTAYGIAPDRFPDGLWNIPESGNGVSDMLDEAAWELAWLLKMQDVSDGGVYHKATRNTWDSGEPHEDPRPRFVTEKSTHDTATFAAIMASASRIWAGIDAQLSATFLARSELAWQFLQAHPNPVPANGVFNPPGQITGEYNDSDDTDNRLWAAAELYRTTGQTQYRQYFEDWWNDPGIFHPNSQGQPGWKQHFLKVYWAYQDADWPDADATIQADLRDTYFISPAANQIIPRTYGNSYHTGARSDVPGFVGFGSHSRSMTYTFPLLQAWHLTGDDVYFDAAALNADVQLGANPLSQSFVTGVGARYPMRPLQGQSIHDDVIEPVPGIPVFGVATHLSNGTGAGFTTQSDDNNFPYTFDSLDPLPIMRRFFDEHRNPKMAEFSIIGQAQLVTSLHLLTPPPTGGQVVGHVFEDADRDADWDLNERGLAGFVVYLDANSNAQRDAGEAFTLSDGAGQYMLTGVAAGTHHIVVEDRAGFVRTTPGIASHSVTVVAGVSTQMGFDFGFRRISDVPVGDIRGVAWYDVNEDGLQHPFEPLLDGWVVFIDDDGNGQLGAGEVSTQTLADGSYRFSGIAPGTYSVVIEQPAGWFATQPASGSQTVTLIPGEGWDDVDFGNRLAAGGIPETPDLISASDSGNSSSDDLTRLNNADAASALQFHVPNTIPGAVVRLYVADVGTSFAAPVDIVPGNVRWSHTADLDGDGDADVLRAAGNDNQISWLKNLDGQGTFGPEQIITTSAASVRSVYTADLDGDGDLDVMSASPADGKFAWYPNTDGAGTFGPQQVIGAPQQWAPYSMAAADFDGDGDLDVLGGTRFNTLRWYENLDGLGTFSSRIVIDPASGDAEFPLAVAVGDLDGDGDIDALAARYNTGELLWYRNVDALGGFSAPIVISAALAGIQSIRVADLDADGDLDVAAGTWDSGKLQWFENVDGLGNFSVEHIVFDGGGAGSRVPSFDVADLDGDGDPDLVASRGHNMEWYANDGAGNFGPTQTVVLNSSSPSAVSAADVNGDGRLDIVSTIGGTRIAWFENVPVDALIGTATADGWRTLVTTDGFSILADGSHTITSSQQQLAGADLFSVNSLAISVDTVAPVVTVDPLVTYETSPELTGTIDDPSATLSLDVNGQGPVAALNAGDGTWRLAAGSISPDLTVGQYDVVVVTTDAAGNSAGDATTNELEIIPPPNLPPTSDAGGPYDVDEGGGVTLDGSASSDPDDNLQDFEWDLDYDGVTFEIDATGSSPVFDAAGLDGPLQTTVALRVRDAFGEESIDTALVTIHNVAPVVTSLVSGNDEACESSSNGHVLISGAFDDPAGPLDTHAVSVDWGDGSAVELIAVDQSADTFSGSHDYVSGGVYAVTVTAVDSDGGASAAVATTAVVQGVGLVDGVLFVIGTDQKDHVDVKLKKRDRLQVKTNFTSPRKQSFDLSDVGSIVISLCEGNDHAHVHRKVTLPVTIDGGDGRDHLQAGNGDATLIGGSGDDHLDGRDGNDVIDGGPGDDRIRSRDGDDVIVDLSGNNHIRGGDGNDTISTGDGDDRIDGGDGNDLINAGDGRNRVRGGHGDDIILSGSGMDDLAGNNGNDIIKGGAGNDRVNGGRGRDVLIGGTGRDRINGDRDDDLIIGGSADNEDDAESLEDAMSAWSNGDLTSALLSLGPVLDDGVRDELRGGRGNNHVIGGAGDKIKS